MGKAKRLAVPGGAVPAAELRVVFSPPEHRLPVPPLPVVRSWLAVFPPIVPCPPDHQPRVERRRPQAFLPPTSVAIYRLLRTSVGLPWTAFVHLPGGSVRAPEVPSVSDRAGTEGVCGWVAAGQHLSRRHLGVSRRP